jgi:hypothetical protein
VLAKWKEYFEEHLNVGSKSEHSTRLVDLRYDGVDIDLPSREKIKGALKYLKNNKEAGVDSITAEHAVIQQAWTGETLPRSWTEGYCVRYTRRAINSIVKTIEEFASWT